MSKFLGISPVLFDALNAAGVVPNDPTDVRRVVIDLQAGRVGMVYIETFADDEKLLVALEGGLRVETGDAA